MTKIRRNTAVGMLGIAAWALAGCATTTARPTDPNGGQKVSAPVVSIGSEPSIQVGKVVAVYMTVDVSGGGSGWVDRPEAVNESGEHVIGMALDQTADKAGGEKNLIAALDHVPSVAKDVGYNVALSGGEILMIIYAPLAPFIFYEGLKHIDHDRLLYATFGCGYFGDWPRSCETTTFRVKGSGRLEGYVFYDINKYRALEVTSHGEPWSPGNKHTASCAWR